MTREGQVNDEGELLLLDKWANEASKRVRAWRQANGDVRIEFVDAGKAGEPAYDSLTLASYRAEDLAKAIIRHQS